jgi:hypothetical protein
VRVTLPRPLRVPIAFQAMPLLQRFSNPHGGRQRSRLAYPFLSTHCLANSAEYLFGLPSIFLDSHYMIVKEHKKTPGFHQRLGVSCLWIPLSSGVSLFFIRLREAGLYHNYSAIDAKQCAITK